MTRGRAFLVGLLVGLVAGVAVVAVTPWGNDLVSGPAALSDQALELIEDNYWREADVGELEDAGVRAMVRKIRREFDDRFSHYFDPEQFARFRSATSGEFSGVGLSVSEVGRGLRVSGVFEGAPAEEAGITEGEIIVAVDGVSIAGQPAQTATALIQGEPGTEVELSVLDTDTGETREVAIERADVRVPAVTGELDKVDGRDVGYIRFTTFSEGAGAELRAEIEDLYDRGAEGLVLDLRGNGGGLLDEAVLSASVFVDEGVIVTTRGRARPERDFQATGDAIDPRPIVVLVNRDTASASEILTAALAERDLATVVGGRTFGKGVFQEVIGLDGGGALDLTVGEYVTGDGESLAGDGIQPDVRVRPDDETDADEVRDRGLEVLAGELDRGS